MNDISLLGQIGLTHSPSRLSRVLGWIADICVIAIITLLPLWFLPITLDILELNKQTLLIVLTMIAVVAWMGKALADRSFSLSRSWMHLIVLGFGAGYAVTSWFSLDRYLSFIGNVGQMQWAFATVAALILFYFVIVNRFRSQGQLYDLVLWFLLGSCLVGIYGLLQMIGIHLVPGVAASKGFNSIGTVNALGVFMVIPTVIAASLRVLGCRERTCVLADETWKGKFWHGVVWATLVIGLLTAVAVDSWIVWAGLLFGDLLLVVIPFLRTRTFGRPVTLVVPAILALLSILLLLFRTPLSLDLPTEVSPSPVHSWQIARQTLQERPLFGSGPGTWTFDYAKYRSVGANLSPFWNVRFERGPSAFLTLFAMLGIVGTSLWLILIASAILKSGIHLVRERNDDRWQAYLTIFAGWMTLVFLSFLANYNLAHQAVFWFLLALLGVMAATGEWSWEQKSRPLLSTILSIAFLIVAVGAIASAWLAGQRLMAEIAYSKAVTSFQKGTDIQDSINGLEEAAALNRLNDAYPRNLSQAYLVKAGRMLSSKQDEDTVKQARALIGQALEQATRATHLSAANVDNWSNLAVVQQAITSFTPGADEQAIANYQEALKREPNNPSFMNEVGKLYILRADAYGTKLNDSEEGARQEAQVNAKTQLGLAADWFNKAITAKPDYAEAHFNLALVYEREGKLKDAVAKVEQVLAANPQDTGIAFQLATLYFRAGDKAASRTLFEQIVQAAPKFSNARWLLSGVYEDAGLYDEAIAQVEEVEKVNPGVPEVQARLETLKKARDEKRPPKAQPLPQPVPENIQAPGTNPVQAP